MAKLFDWVNYSNPSIIASPADKLLTHPTNSTLDFAIIKNISAAEANSINALRSDHNPIFFVFQLAAVVPVHLRALTTTNWSRFQSIISSTVPGNPKIESIEDIENAIAKLEFEITAALNLSSRTKAINTTHYKLSFYITRKITYKNHTHTHIRKLHQLTRYPSYKSEENRLG
ncbi:hypothetical protein AVEN_211114-1 [Araneus ventricosus]|uniref:Endonuclease/exonuclease/phosphatase domain-containing protein n=1 Tax=Araneus ventricosus TaxID=182803 RepID=A0A4Y2TLA4_ARAVE|nr:hypothetical protein AVEN_211114-1 [Araneus ventricosus]